MELFPPPLSSPVFSMQHKKRVIRPPEQQLPHNWCGCVTQRLKYGIKSTNSDLLVQQSTNQLRENQLGNGEQIYVRDKPQLAVKKMFAENTSITGLSKVWSSLSCSNYPRYHSCGWKMQCFINLTHSCLLRPTTSAIPRASHGFSSAIENSRLGPPSFCCQENFGGPHAHIGSQHYKFAN